MTMPEELFVNGESWVKVSPFFCTYKSDSYLSECEVFALRYAALDLLSSLEDYIFPLHWEELDDMNSIQDSELYLWNFEGLNVFDSEGDEYNLKSMGFNVNKDRKIICVNVWKGDEDAWYVWN